MTVPPPAEDDGSSGGSGSGGGGAGTYYANCTAVRSAGAAPIHAGEPGYGRHLDRDGDGVACE
ncbi:excalibur calcium-binding domain-containing protein [Streptomyces sp. CLV115]|uniref:excalibur calcium-binding domain-containing protein n=1 Tax=Streptomyces sp. CLV115 TaxID=3138502 RepID=UPI00313D7E1D